jgi:hypothetical protein
LALLGDHCTLRSTVSIYSAQLNVYNDTTDGSPAVPLGSITFADLHVSYFSTAKANMFVKVRVCVCEGGCEA